METGLTTSVDTKVDNPIKATFEKLDKSHAEVMAVQPRKTRNVLTRPPTKTMSDIDLNIFKSLRTQGVREDPQKSKVDYLVAMAHVKNGILAGMGMASHITELR